MSSLKDLGYKKKVDFSESRPWGRYDVLLDTNFTKVKIITVAPGQRLSYQSHKYRQEQWVVVRGELRIVLEDKDYIRYPGESIRIPLGAKHRAWNDSDKITQFIEVQTGESFKEEDITRYQDDYER